MQKCKVIVRYGIGVDNVDLKAAAAKGIPVCNVPDYCIDEVADTALAMILDLTRKITANAAKVKAGGWGLAVPLQALHVLKSMTVGVVGFGRIGREVAARLRAFKCKVLVYDPMIDEATVRAAGCTAATLPELLSSSDLVTLHCPSNPQTQYMINSQSISTMKPGVMLVNTFARHVGQDRRPGGGVTKRPDFRGRTRRDRPGADSAGASDREVGSVHYQFPYRIGQPAIGAQAADRRRHHRRPCLPRREAAQHRQRRKRVTH